MADDKPGVQGVRGVAGVHGGIGRDELPLIRIFGRHTFPLL